MDELVSILRVDIRLGNTENLHNWVGRIPMCHLWPILLDTYATDIGCAPLALYVWKKYNEGTVGAAYELAYVMAKQVKFRMARFVTTTFWKNRIQEGEAFVRLLSEMVGNLQSNYINKWDPVLQYRIFAAASMLTSLDDAWKYIIEIAPILGIDILKNLLAIRNMHKITGHIEFFVLALISLTQPGEWDLPNMPTIPPFREADCSVGVPDYCFDITTNSGWELLRLLAEGRNYTQDKAIRFGIRNYYNCSLKVDAERSHILLPIYKKSSILTDTGRFDLSLLHLEIQNVLVLSKLPRKNSIFDMVELRQELESV